MIIGLTGYARSGKDTVAKTLVDEYGYKRIAFADAIRDMLYELNPMVDSIVGEPIFLQSMVKRYGWEEAKSNPRVRQYLQKLGVAARDHIDENIWVTAAFNKMNDPMQNYVITDVRFENEANTIKESNGQIWRIKRPGVDAVNDHVSEHALDNYKVDQIFLNSSSLEDLDLLIKSRMQSLV